MNLPHSPACAMGRSARLGEIRCSSPCRSRCWSRRSPSTSATIGLALSLDATSAPGRSIALRRFGARGGTREKRSVAIYDDAREVSARDNVAARRTAARPRTRTNCGSSTSPRSELAGRPPELPGFCPLNHRKEIARMPSQSTHSDLTARIVTRLIYARIRAVTLPTPASCQDMLSGSPRSHLAASDYTHFRSG